MKKMVIGITGGMGTGKSTVAGMMKSLAKNSIVLDADKIAERFLKRGSSSFVLVCELFPEAVDHKGDINRKKLADAVFSDDSRLKSLNRLIHPLVVRAVKKKLEGINRNVIVLDVPLLIEADMLGVVDKLVVVADKKAIAKRSRFPKKEIERRTKKQMTFRKKLSVARKVLGKNNVFIIDNSLDTRNTKRQVSEIWLKMRR